MGVTRVEMNARSGSIHLQEIIEEIFIFFRLRPCLANTFTDLCLWPFPEEHFIPFDLVAKNIFLSVSIVFAIQADGFQFGQFLRPPLRSVV